MPPLKRCPERSSMPSTFRSFSSQAPRGAARRRAPARGVGDVANLLGGKYLESRGARPRETRDEFRARTLAIRVAYNSVI
eukprot:6078117-Prymnesium_polylepis.1